MKKLLSFILVLALAISCVSMMTFTAQAATYGSFTYEITDGHVIITDCNTSVSGEVVIPSTIEGYPVTSIGSFAFDSCSSLTSITIPDSVTSIGSFAFDSCSSLTSITIPNSVTSIGNRAFSDCSSLTSVTIGDSVTSIGSYAFSNCSSLTSVTIPDSVTSIGSSAFHACSSLTSITIPDSVTSIGSSAFHACSSLTSITIPNSVTSIGEYTFSECSKLTSVTIPDSVTSIGACAFRYCSSLTSITIPDSVTSIVSYIFYKCSSLTSITIPDGVASIGSFAFEDCSSLESITIPDSVTSIGSSAFEYCSKLSTVYYNGTDEQWNNIAIDLNNDSLKNAKLENTIAYFEYEIKDNQVTITGFDTSKGGEIEIPATIEGYPVTKIGESAFEECNLITEIVIPETVTEIGAWAFYNCSSLAEINIPASVTKINSYTFYNCSALTDVYFNGTEEQWAKVTISSGNTPLKNAKVYCNADGHKDITKYLTYTISSGKVTITGCDTSVSGDYFIPSTIDGYPVTSIGSDAFWDCSSLTSIIIPDGVTSIGDGAFLSCGSLSTITIPDGVTSIDFSTFQYCSSLTNVIIPDSVTSIGDGAFLSCGSLSTITIPDSVISIGEYAFSSCDSLTSITIPDSVTSIGDWAFYGCNKLTSITIPDSVTSIGAGTFDYCEGLTSIVIPSSVTSIGEDAFSSCDSLTSITIPDSVTSIGEDAFSYCGSLTTVYYLGTKTQWNKITIGSNNTDLTKAKLICLDVQITGSTVDVGATLTINYFAKIDNLDKFNLTADDFTMRFTSAKDKVYLVKGVFDAETGYYKYPYTGINPQCMNDNIKAELICNDEVVAIKEIYSVKEYCERQGSRTAQQLGLSGVQYQAFKTLLADMLVYGSASQKYMNYNTDELPDAEDWVQEYKSVFTVPTGIKKITGNTDKNNKIKSAGLNMANVNRIYFKVKITDDAIVKLNGVEVDKTTMIKNADGTYTLYSDDIKATQFNDVFALTVIDDGTEIAKVEYNVNAYIQAKYNASGLENIVKALSNYGKSATDYANSMQSNSTADSDFNLEEDELY